jgi:hypothetical protein
MKHNYFRSGLMIAFALVLFLPACANAASVPIATPTQAATNTPEATATSTSTPTAMPSPTKTPKPTITPNLEATQQVEEFSALVKKYYDAGQITTTDGEYMELDDYQDESALKLQYTWVETGVTAKNFIVQADFEWSNGTRTVNTSGCGFVYRVQPNQDHYLIILDAFSGVKLASSTDRGTYSMGSPQNGDQKVSDFGPGPYHATFALIVNDLQTYVYLNDIYVGEYKLLDYRITESGPLATAVLSGGSTSCKMTNVRAWVLDS